MRGGPKQLDEFDRKILRELQANSRLSNTDLAGRVGLSPSLCWSRVKQLEDAGYIESYAAVLDQRKLGLPDSVIVEVTLDPRAFRQGVGQLSGGLGGVFNDW
jgi:Lrp/AsnC family transcriptional regulator, leucine-responsive regulatory protein